MMGKGVRIAHEFSVDDGYLDVFVLGRDALSIMAAETRVLKLPEAPMAHLKCWRGQSITVEAEPTKTLWTDGELYGETPVTVTVAPGVTCRRGARGEIEQPWRRKPALTSRRSQNICSFRTGRRHEHAEEITQLGIGLVLSMHWIPPQRAIRRLPLRVLWLPTIDTPLTPMPLHTLRRGVERQRCRSSGAGVRCSATARPASIAASPWRHAC
jgi:hypothetical protein